MHSHAGAWERVSLVLLWRVSGSGELVRRGDEQPQRELVLPPDQAHLRSGVLYGLRAAMGITETPSSRK